MKTEKIKIKEDNILTVKVKVKNKVEAYAVVSELGFDYDVQSAEINGHKETFDKKNAPAQFFRDNSKNKKIFRDIKAERSKK
jgi:hypothetical protein